MARLAPARFVDGVDLAAIPADASTKGYRRAGDRKAPYNVIGDTRALLARAGTGATSGDPGFRFGPAGPSPWRTGRSGCSWSPAGQAVDVG
ncbi:MAG: hypothetical protein M3171_07070 [Actinomycetota bacterium]|nr:hypothetical protein [Actinomycetota bacterium]